MPVYFPPPTSYDLDGLFTLATLPPAADNARRLAWVTDLHDGQPDKVISDGTSWKPVRPFAARVVTNANTAMTLTALVNSPTQIMQGTLTANRTITLSPTNAYRGARFRIKREAGGLFGLIVAALSPVTMGLNSWADFEFDGSNWIQTASGGLL